jgi:uncharacterized protein
MSPTFAQGKICYLEIATADIAASSHFYQDVLGWRLRERGGGAAAFDDGVGEVSGTWVLGRPPSAEPGLCIHVMVRDVAETSRRVVEGGGEIVQPHDDEADEVYALFRDPYGNVLGLYQNSDME